MLHSDHLTIACPSAFCLQAVLNGGVPKQGLMPDGLHPNVAGMELMAECLEAKIGKLMARPVTTFNARAPQPGSPLQPPSLSKSDAVLAASAE